MFRPRVIPVLLLHQEVIVKTTCFENPSYIGDPINTVALFSSMGADEVVILDISARKNAREFAPELVAKLSQETAMPLSVGGGIDSLQHIERLIEAGAEKIILNTTAMNEPEFLREAVREFGSSTIAVCMDVRKKGDDYTIYTNNGTVACALSLKDSIQQTVDAGAGELILQSIDRDGTLSGYDEDLYAQTALTCPIPILALGGMNGISQTKELFQNYGVNGFGVGKYFSHFGNSVLISYERFPEGE